MGCNDSKPSVSTPRTTPDDQNPDQQNDYRQEAWKNDETYGERVATRRIKPMRQIDLTEDVLDQYVQLEKDIYKLERLNVERKYRDHTLHVEELKKIVHQLEATFKELKKQTVKESMDHGNSDVPVPRSYTLKRDHDDLSSYSSSLEKLELVQNELQNARQDYEQASQISDIYRRRCEMLYALYEKEDHLLADVFGTEYASQLENSLETQLDEASEWQHRVALARFKWVNARVLLVHACAQMAFGVSRWKEVERIDPSNTRLQYFSAAEAKNNFIASGQNIQSCKVYLSQVKLPYCTEEVMATFEKAITNTFSDVHSPEKFKKSVETYQNVHKNVSSLIHWFDKVLNDIIIIDYDQANDTVEQYRRELRAERLRLMQAATTEKLGRPLEIPYEEPSEADFEDIPTVTGLSNIDASRLSAIHSIGLAPFSINNAPPSPSRSDLAQLPSEAVLFGIRQQHEQEKNNFETQQHLARAQVDRGLQQKLNERRTRRERIKDQTLGYINSRSE